MGRSWVLGLLAAAVLAGCGSGTGAPAQGGAEGALWDSLPRGWLSLEAPPIARSSAVSVWTGSELFYWGGDTSYDATHFAALYNPATGTWRRVPAGPLSPRSSPGAVWTGKEVFVWGGWAGQAREWADGALFEPASGSWRKAAPSPLSPRVPVAVIWTGSEVIVWGDRSRLRSQREGAAYDPAADRWRPLPHAPLALNQAYGLWTGEEMIVFGALLDGNNWSQAENAQGIAYDPQVNSWRVLSDFPLSPQASAIAWTDREVLAWDYELKAAAYDPARDTWRKLSDLPLRFSECYPESVRLRDSIVAWFCGQGEIFDISTSTWTKMPPAPRAIYGFPVAAGSVVLFAGAAGETEPTPTNALWAYKP